ncbi:MAG: AGE family epimerase/isomerase [Planctomycetota bacterium]|jgi:mannose/cellobiose epimerase-like protein (N-acyl-D-glucosamine 2-epimerase family)
MKRREFLRGAMAGGVVGAMSVSGKAAVPGKKLKSKAVKSERGALSAKTSNGVTAYCILPNEIAGMSLEQLRDDYRDRLFNRYLPFWEKGGYDKKFGGFMCELNDDGSVHSDEKDIWYQGRGIWVYSFLYNNFGKDRRWLEAARKTRDFMVKNMYAGAGKWIQSVHRDGKAMTGTTAQGAGDDIFGAMFSAAGLIEYYKAAGNTEDLELAKTSIRISAKRYDDPNYRNNGLRSQGHSFMMVWTLTQLLSYHNDGELEQLMREHVDNIMNKHWHPKYGILNEQLQHDYSRIPAAETSMIPGHSIESLWMVMFEALRIKDKGLFCEAKNRFRRVVEMNWDYVFEGFAEQFNVFSTSKRPAGPNFEIKCMWPLCEILVGCMTVLEYSGDVWAREWYERVRAFTLRTMTTDYGVWRQAVDRFGKDKKRATISVYRKGNFHQPRYMMLDMLSLDRMIKNNGKLTPLRL